MLSEKQLFDIWGFYEKDRFIFVKNEYVYDFYCQHIEPHELKLNDPPVSSKRNESRVSLKEYKLSNGNLGFTGKCDVCGKVYYK